MKANSRGMSDLTYGFACAYASGKPNTQKWRVLYRETLDSFDPAIQGTLILNARKAIFDRLLDLCGLSDSHQDEERLLEEALRQLWIVQNEKAN
jgi:hypothetical protein